MLKISMRGMNLDDIESCNDSQLAALCKFLLLIADFIDGHLTRHLTHHEGLGIFDHAPGINDMVVGFISSISLVIHRLPPVLTYDDHRNDPVDQSLWSSEWLPRNQNNEFAR